MFAVFRQLAGMMFFARTNHSEESAPEGRDAAANGKTHAGRILMGNLPEAQLKVAIGQEFSPPKLRAKNFFKKKRIRP